MDKIEIPFGAYDSETLGWTYTIPKGYIAKIEDGKIVVKKEELEDEKIKKSLVKFLKSLPIKHRCEYAASELENWLAWLEKQKEQKEQKPVEKPEDIHNRGYVKGVEDAYNNVNEAKVILKKLEKENPKPVEWSEEDEAALISILYCISQAIKNVNDENERNSLLNAKSWIQYKLKFHIPSRISHPSPSWKPSEDEKRLINTSISFLKDFADKGYENAVECIDWLKSKLNGNTGK